MPIMLCMDLGNHLCGLRRHRACGGADEMVA
jgi:hypothetical protein